MVAKSSKVSIIVPVYNRQELALDLMSSIFAQSYVNWEALLIDDGSDPGVVESLRLFAQQDSRFRVISRNRGPKGANTCRNVGINHSHGAYLLFLDSDDLLSPFAVTQRMASVQADPGADAWLFQVEKFRQRPGDTGEPWNNPTATDHLARFLRRDSVWHTSGPLWRREALEKLNGFDERLACWQDVDLHIRALGAGLDLRLRFDLPADCYYRLHAAETISQRPFSGRAQLESLVTVFQTAAALPACLATEERRAALADMAKHVAFKVLENREFALYRRVYEEALRLELFSAALRSRFLMLKGFFRCGGYRIKGTHRLRGYLRRMAEC